MNRRDLFGGGAALLLAVPVSVRGSDTSGDDATLLALCARFLVLETSFRHQCEAEAKAETARDKVAMLAAQAAQEAEHAEYIDTLEAIAALPALTLEGMRAKAEAVYAWFTPDQPDDGAVDRVSWSLILDLTGRVE